MGQGESRLPGGARLGLHVLRVADGSPAADAGLEPFFDFVISANDIPVSENTDSFADTIETNEGRSVRLQVWSSKQQELREVYVVPNQYWSTVANPGPPAADPHANPSLLGLSLRLCNPENALDLVWHVLGIIEGSPAQSAGLVPYGDYILGYAGGVLKTEKDFYTLVENHVDKPLRLFVYNHDYDVTREVVIVPNRSWSAGNGLLGCGIGFGLLHRLPHPRDRPAIFEENDIEHDMENDDLSADTEKAGQLNPSEDIFKSHRAFATEVEKDVNEEANDGLEIIDTSNNNNNIMSTPPPHAHANTTSPPLSKSPSQRPAGMYNNFNLYAPQSNSNNSNSRNNIGIGLPSRARSPNEGRSPSDAPPTSPLQSSLPATIMEEEGE